MVLHTQITSQRSPLQKREKSLDIFFSEALKIYTPVWATLTPEWGRYCMLSLLFTRVLFSLKFDYGKMSYLLCLIEVL